MGFKCRLSKKTREAPSSLYSSSPPKPKDRFEIGAHLLDGGIKSHMFISQKHGPPCNTNGPPNGPQCNTMNLESDCYSPISHVTLKKALFVSVPGLPTVDVVKTVSAHPTRVLSIPSVTRIPGANSPPLPFPFIIINSSIPPVVHH